MLTGHSEKKRVTAARDAGITEFLAKPISAKGLYQRIVNVVANPRPFIKTKTYFGPDRRRNVNPNYVGAERRKGGKADVIRQVAVARKSSRPRLTKERLAMAPRKDTAAVATYGDHEVITPENKLRKAVSDRPLSAGRGGSGRARGKGAGRTVDRILRLDGVRMRAPRQGAARASSRAASARPTRKRCSTPPTTSRAKPPPSAIRPWRRPPTACAG